ncbi:hypothetical protein IFR05_013382 [Cadophora sp. M221]|nr:hypothetical protein IFR05_013382 [Cadophora sp. M221]
MVDSLPSINSQGYPMKDMTTYTFNTIVGSIPYQAYRTRHNSKDVNEAIWPDIIEAPFIKALLEIPPMGRRKQSCQGKLCGRNELIAVYIWNAYLATLMPGERPDMSMMRTRKQVSSHIQVLKGVFKGQLAYEQLFVQEQSTDLSLYNSAGLLRVISPDNSLQFWDDHSSFLEADQEWQSFNL